MLKNENYIKAQMGMDILKEAVFNFLKENPDGLSGSDIGKNLGIHRGFTDGGQTGWITRIILERLTEDGKVIRNHKKKWFAVDK